jgi:exopolysaccharide biosynthesis polyprenyl glycosylphosphotransferase
MKHYLLSYLKKRQYILVAGDLAVMSLVVFVSYIIRVYTNQKNPTMGMVISRLNTWHLMVPVIHVFSLYVLDQYSLSRLTSRVRSALMVLLAVWLSGIIISGVFFFFPKYIFGRQVLLIHLSVASVVMVAWRSRAAQLLATTGQQKRLAVVGDGQIVSSFIEEISRIENCGFSVTNVCISKNPGSDMCQLPVTMGNHTSIKKLLQSNDFDVLTFDSRDRFFTNNEIRELLEVRFRGKAVYDLPSFYKNLTGKVPLAFIDGNWLLSGNGLKGDYSIPYAKMKRFIDIALSMIMLCLTAPIILIIAIAIKLDSKGTVFFIQERLGKDRVPFDCVKFRTMIENAEEHSGPVWSSDEDPRITGTGRFLRKSRLDELPQLLNILKGEMSFVGPRPIREYFAKILEEKIPFYGLRFSVKPGLSGWAQVNYGYAGSEEWQLEKFEYELFYIQNMSIFLDLLTLIKTIQTVLFGKGT